ncbi:hypothetical protein JD844_019760 [Phrynosoma platyrhinos]|uniref:Shisa N-terminal domain-containing protein n=1 Tax=Phrynosoma platyrhinos TaxID=52577 RepID=A0ABQ7TR25_PHRPL|nr:hypothetical protein JD844_019760 [Phrynosoma platyrhinos]
MKGCLGRLLLGSSWPLWSLLLGCRAAEGRGAGAPQHLGSIVLLSAGNPSHPPPPAPPAPPSLLLPPEEREPAPAPAAAPASEPPPPGPEECRGYFDVMGQWDPSFNCSVREYPFCCGTCGFRFCCKYPKGRLDQDLCTNYIKPPWLNGRKAPSRPGADPAHDPTRDKTNLIVYIICGVVAVMVLVGIFTKLGLEKAHRPHREHMSR